MLNSTEHNNAMFINVKIPTSNGILTLIRIIHTSSNSSKARNVFILLQPCTFLSADKIPCSVELCMRNVYNLGVSFSRRGPYTNNPINHDHLLYYMQVL